MILLLIGLLAAQPIERAADPVTGVPVTRFVSTRHETHHYYDISPWDPAGRRILFFRFDTSAGKLSATGRYPGSLWIRDAETGAERQVAAGLEGHYHVGVNQLWGPNGESVFYTQKGRTVRVELESGRQTTVSTPAPANRLNPDFTAISCVRGEEWGLYDIGADRYRRLVTRDEAIALSPYRALVRGVPSGLQNTRFSPDGRWILIVHVTREEFPRLVEMFAYDLREKKLKHLAANLHHPGWRPDSKAVLFVRRREHDNFQSLYEVDVESGAERLLSGAHHVPAGHPSYHPAKPHLIVTDCYGGPLGYGLAVLNTRTGELKQLVTIPSGARPPAPADDRFPFRNWGLWMPQRPYLNEPRPVWSADGARLLFTSEESGRMNLYVADTSGL
jgi:Tol biopolymer transport system component